MEDEWNNLIIAKVKASSKILAILDELEYEVGYKIDKASLKDIEYRFVGSNPVVGKDFTIMFDLKKKVQRKEI